MLSLSVEGNDSLSANSGVALTSAASLHCSLAARPIKKTSRNDFVGFCFAASQIYCLLILCLGIPVSLSALPSAASPYNYLPAWPTKEISHNEIDGFCLLSAWKGRPGCSAERFQGLGKLLSQDEEEGKVESFMRFYRRHSYLRWKPEQGVAKQLSIRGRG